MATIGLTLVLCACVDYWAYPYGIASDSRGFNRGENGLWLRYTWYFGQHSTAEARQLAQQLRARQIRYAYFHVRHVNAQGRLVFRYPDAAKTLMQLLRRIIDYNLNLNLSELPFSSPCSPCSPWFILFSAYRRRCPAYCRG